MDYFSHLNSHNTKVTIKPLGVVELKYISGGDSIKFSEILSEKVSPKILTEKILFNQLLTPKITFDELRGLQPQQMEKMADAFVKNESHTFAYYKSTGSPYEDFIKALKVYQQKELEDFSKSFKPLIASTQLVFQDFNKNYASIISQSLTGSSAISSALSEISKINSLATSNLVAGVADAIKPAIEQLGSVANSIAQSLVPQIEIWQTWANKNQSLFEGTAKIWTDYNKQYNVAEKKAAAVLKKYKWFVSPSVPVTLIFEVQKLDKKPGRHDKAVNEFFIGYFEANSWRNLENMVSGWSKKPLFKKRYKIISDCLETVKVSSKTNVNISSVVLPTLIIQIDGILNDYMTLKGLAARGYNDRNAVLRANRPRILSPDLDNLASDIFLNILFQQSFPGVPLATPFNFNRHKILHAENTKYGRKDYLVRAFMVLDLLASLS
jgi:hypothetical protein